MHKHRSLIPLFDKCMFNRSGLLTDANLEQIAKNRHIPNIFNSMIDNIGLKKQALIRTKEINKFYAEKAAQSSGRLTKFDEESYKRSIKYHTLVIEKSEQNISQFKSAMSRILEDPSSPENIKFSKEFYVSMLQKSGVDVSLGSASELAETNLSGEYYQQTAVGISSNLVSTFIVGGGALILSKLDNESELSEAQEDSLKLIKRSDT